MADNAWLSCPASEEILFDCPPEERVDRAAASLGIDFRLMSGTPGHA
jgi:putative transcriptional regulator